MGQGSAKNLAAISGVTITGSPTSGQVLTATSPSAATWQAGSQTTSFVFQPGGTAGGNVYTTETSLATAASSVEGATTIVFDLSFVSASYTFTTVGNLNFGKYCTWIDGDYSINASLPGRNYGSQNLLIFANSTTVSYPPNVAGNLAIQVNQSTPVVTWTGTTQGVGIIISQDVSIVANSGPFIEASNSQGGINVVMKDNSYVHGTSSSVFSAPSGNIVISLEDSAHMDANSMSGGDTLALALGSGVVVDSSYYVGHLDISGLYVDTTGTGLTIMAGDQSAGTLMSTGGVLYQSNASVWVPLTGATPLPFTFQPNGTAALNVFTNENALNFAVGAASGPPTVYVDLNANSGAYTTANSLTLGPYFVGVPFYTNGLTPVLTLATAVTLAGSGTTIEIKDIRLLQQSGPNFSNPLTVRATGDTILYSADSSNLYVASSTNALELYDNASLGVTGFPNATITVTGTLNIYMYGSSSIQASALVNSSGVINIFVNSSAVFIDPSYVGMSGVTITYNDVNLAGVAVSGSASTGQVLTATSSSAASWQTPGGGSLTLPIVFLPGGSAEPNVFNNESDLNTYVNAAFGPQTVYTNFASHTGSYPASGNLNLGAYIYAVLGDFADQAPTLTTASQITTPIEIHDLQISTSAGPNFPNEAPYLKLYGIAGLKSTDNTAIYTVTFPDILDMYGTSYLGDGTNQVIHVSSTGNLTINIYDSATINAGALVVDAGGTVIINVRSPSTSIASGYLAGFTGVTINYLFAGTNITGGIQTGTFALASGTVSVPANINSGNTVVVITLTGLSGTPPYANQYAVNALSVGASGTGGSFTVTAYDVSGSAVTSDNSTFSYIIIG